MQLTKAIDRFKRGLIGQGASKNTIATYMRHLRLLTQHFNGIKVEEITSADLNDFLYAVRLKADGNAKNQRTVNSIKTALKSFFKSLNLKQDPADDLRIKRVRIERDYITEDEVRVLLAGVNSVRDRTILAVLCFLGLRREEIVDLKVADIQGPALRIFGKGGVERDIPINRCVRGYLDQFIRWKEERGESLDRSAPECWTIESFPFRLQKGVNRRQINTFAGLDFVPKAENLVFIGPTGVGKTGLATGLLLKALQNGYRALFIKAQDLFDEMYASLADRSTRTLLNQLARVDVLCVDEMGYLTIKPEQANIFFKLMEERYTRKPTIITTNLAYDEWHQFLGNRSMVEALLSRLRHRCHTVEIAGPSLRDPQS